MIGVSLSHMVLLFLIVLVLFGAGRIPQVMADLAKGLKAFKDAFQDPKDHDAQ